MLRELSSSRSSADVDHGVRCTPATEILASRWSVPKSVCLRSTVCGSHGCLAFQLLWLTSNSLRFCWFYLFWGSRISRQSPGPVNARKKPAVITTSILFTRQNSRRDMIQTADFLLPELFFRLANDRSSCAPANKGYMSKHRPCRRQLRPNLRWLFTPSRKLPARPGAVIPIRLTQIRTKPFWLPPIRWTIAADQSTLINNTGMACNPKLPDPYCHRTAKSPASKANARVIRGNPIALRKYIHFPPITSQSGPHPAAWATWTFLWVSLFLRSQQFMKFCPLNSLPQTWMFPSSSFSALCWLLIVVNFHFLVCPMWRWVWLQFISIRLSQL